MTRGRKRGGASVLSRQKLKKTRSRLGAAFKTRRLVLGIVTFILAMAAGFYLSTQPKVTRKDVGAWQITLKSEDAVPLSDAAANQVLATVRKHLGSGSQAELRRAARSAQQTDSYAAVHVMRTGQRAVTVQVRSRVPLFCAEADRLRFVSAEGSLYGTPEGPEICPGPVLRGLFANDRSRFTMGDDLTVALDETEQSTVREAMELLRLAGVQNLKVIGLESRRYRGFFLTVASSGGHEVEVAVGRTPFAPTLAKLSGILDKLSEKGEVAQRVELDYQGKTFIKLKKM